MESFSPDLREALREAHLPEEALSRLLGTLERRGKGISRQRVQRFIRLLTDLKGGRLVNLTSVQKRKGLENLVYYVYLNLGLQPTIKMLDKLKELGFNYSTFAGFSLGIDDFIIPKDKAKLIDKAQKDVQRIEDLYREGTISAGERFNRVVEIWGSVTDRISGAMIDTMREVSFEGDELNPLFVMADSGSRGTAGAPRGRWGRAHRRGFPLGRPRVIGPGIPPTRRPLYGLLMALLLSRTGEGPGPDSRRVTIMASRPSPLVCAYYPPHGTRILHVEAGFHGENMGSFRGHFFFDPQRVPLGGMRT